MSSHRNKNQEYNRGLKEQLINGLNDETITDEIIKELTVIKDTSKLSAEKVLVWGQTVEVQREQRAVSDDIRDAKDFASIQGNRQRSGQNSQ